MAYAFIIALTLTLAPMAISTIISIPHRLAGTYIEIGSVEHVLLNLLGELALVQGASALAAAAFGIAWLYRKARAFSIALALALVLFALQAFVAAPPSIITLLSLPGSLATAVGILALAAVAFGVAWRYRKASAFSITVCLALALFALHNSVNAFFLGSTGTYPYYYQRALFQSLFAAQGISALAAAAFGAAWLYRRARAFSVALTLSLALFALYAFWRAHPYPIRIYDYQRCYGGFLGYLCSLENCFAQYGWLFLVLFIASALAIAVFGIAWALSRRRLNRNPPE